MAALGNAVRPARRRRRTLRHRIGTTGLGIQSKCLRSITRGLRLVTHRKGAVTTGLRTIAHRNRVGSACGTLLTQRRRAV
ncbi:MAG TPA: hypothetical protein VK018_01300, partial [Porticoccaceae bacterium]|nr:hypothetical protein [Porticoccaceae bacterium]